VKKAGAAKATTWSRPSCLKRCRAHPREKLDGKASEGCIHPRIDTQSIYSSFGRHWNSRCIGILCRCYESLQAKQVPSLPAKKLTVVLVDVVPGFDPWRVTTALRHHDAVWHSFQFLCEARVQGAWRSGMSGGRR